MMLGNERLDTLTTRSVGIICSPPYILIILATRFSHSKVFMYIWTPPPFLKFADTDRFLSSFCICCSQASRALSSYQARWAPRVE